LVRDDDRAFQAVYCCAEVAQIMRVVLFAASALVAASAVFAQSGGVILQQPNTPVGLVPVSTGILQTVAVTNASVVCLCQPAYDVASQRVFFYAQRSGIPTIFFANVQSGAVGSVAITPSTVVSPLVWDPVSGRLLSFTGFGPGPLQVVSIDPSTGAAQTLFTTAISFVDSMLALDTAGRRLFVLSNNSIGTQQLDVINLTNGNVTTVSIASATTTYNSMHYDPFTNKLIVLASGGFGTRILSIDPVTGASQILVTAPFPIFTVPLGMAFEPISRLAIVFNGGTNQLVFINITNGSITSSGSIGPLLPYGFFAVPAGATVPALGPFALIALAIALAGVALRRT
jgi:hypothetical protein